MTGPMPRATSAAMDRAPIGPAPITMTESPGAAPDRVNPVQRYGERLGQRSLAGGQSGRPAEQGDGRDQHISGERPVPVVDDRAPFLALGGSSRPTAPTASAAR